MRVLSKLVNLVAQISGGFLFCFHPKPLSFHGGSLLTDLVLVSTDKDIVSCSQATRSTLTRSQNARLSLPGETRDQPSVDGLLLV